MYDELYALQDGSGEHAIKSCSSGFLLMMESTNDGLSEDQMLDIWEIVGSTVARIYCKDILSREEIG